VTGGLKAEVCDAESVIIRAQLESLFFEQVFNFEDIRFMGQGEL
jgi:hypothetical protein